MGIAIVVFGIIFVGVFVFIFIDSVVMDWEPISSYIINGMFGIIFGITFYFIFVAIIAICIKVLMM